MLNRRQLLEHSATVAGLLAAAGMLPRSALAAWPQAAFDTHSLTDAVKALGGAAPVESKEVSISGPDIAENGAVVPLVIATSLPGVKRLLLLVEKNPNALAAVFDINEAVEPNLATRVKMGQSSNVYAVAMLGDGKVLFAVKDIKVTLGGCGA